MPADPLGYPSKKSYLYWESKIKWYSSSFDDVKSHIFLRKCLVLVGLWRNHTFSIGLGRALAKVGDAGILHPTVQLRWYWPSLGNSAYSSRLDGVAYQLGHVEYTCINCKLLWIYISQDLSCIKYTYSCDSCCLTKTLSKLFNPLILSSCWGWGFPSNLFSLFTN